MKIIVFLGLFFSSTLLGGVKEDFVQEVVKQCKVSKEEAEQLATPGRTGNIFKWRKCYENPVKTAKCPIVCVKKGTNIGN